MAPLPKHAVITVTSANADLFNGKETTKTGNYTPYWLSLQADFFNGSDKEMYDDLQSEFRQKLDNMPTPSELDGNKYGIFFASAGHAALIDYPNATGLQKIAEVIWANGGVVSAVCHGPAIFANIKDKATGKPVIAGRTITGFTNEGEDVLR
ncbi:IgE-binging protein [Trichoderma harzianum]|uniref:IgE-binging protein n=1 Tax=Trichoderma harzianum TaxID=5544 RepID=A0A0F9ZK51_TRIHA|nr:IgE-binging protein [Trichoderma harzianum]